MPVFFYFFKNRSRASSFYFCSITFSVPRFGHPFILLASQPVIQCTLSQSVQLRVYDKDCQRRESRNISRKDGKEWHLQAKEERRKESRKKGGQEIRKKRRRRRKKTGVHLCSCSSLHEYKKKKTRTCRNIKGGSHIIFHTGDVASSGVKKLWGAK